MIRPPFAQDLHRPRFHYLPPSNWMNDPNGIIQWKGTYHLFYQYNPFGALWGNMHWGHATSPDLIHWTDAPIALAPTSGSDDEKGVFSGCAVDNNGIPTILYTAVRGEQYETQVQAIATSSDDLMVWDKSDRNPVISRVPAEAHQTRDFRDPFVWKEDDTWYMLVASRIQEVGGTVFLYRSADLLAWEYLHPLLTGDKTLNGDFWECPNFFPIGDQSVLIVSAHTAPAINSVIYFVGDYRGGQFTPHTTGILEHGCLYAPLTMLDDQERRLMIGWIRETRTEAELVRAGWAGVQSIPRTLALDDQYRLIMQPVIELETLRTAHHHLGDMPLNGSTSLDTSGLWLDIKAAFRVDAEGECGLTFAFSEDERITIGWDAVRQTLYAESVSVNTKLERREVPHGLYPTESLAMRILLDGSVVEVIANQRTSLTMRVYPTETTRCQLTVFGHHTRLHSLDAWEMSSIWE
ncbi:MAG: glycoside hydrolase family 32 protein [Anaerolineae bacterium]